MNPNDPQTLDSAEELNAWALLELFGHTKIAGRVTTRKLGTEVMFQVDVPKGDTEFSHSRLFNPKAVFSVNPTTEQWCRKWAAYAAECGYSVLPYIPEPTKAIAAPDNDNEGAGLSPWSEDHDLPTACN
jgi:hypothetical protein